MLPEPERYTEGRDYLAIKRHELSVIVDQLEFSGGKREQTGDASVTPAPESELDLYDEDIPF